VPELLATSLNKLTHDAWLELGTITLVICFCWYSILWIDNINRTHFTSFTNTIYELLADITFIFNTPWFSALCWLYSSHHTFNIVILSLVTLGNIFLCMLLWKDSSVPCLYFSTVLCVLTSVTHVIFIISVLQSSWKSSTVESYSLRTSVFRFQYFTIMHFSMTVLSFRDRFSQTTWLVSWLLPLPPTVQSTVKSVELQLH
jgi:hypothetical protein